jgi:hypothetical protein
VQQYRVGREAGIGEALRRKRTDGNMISSVDHGHRVEA